jgi:hypothetical protein
VENVCSTQLNSAYYYFRCGHNQNEIDNMSLTSNIRWLVNCSFFYVCKYLHIKIGLVFVFIVTILKYCEISKRQFAWEFLIKRYSYSFGIWISSISAHLVSYQLENYDNIVLYLLVKCYSKFGRMYVSFETFILHSCRRAGPWFAAFVCCNLFF